MPAPTPERHGSPGPHGPHHLRIAQITIRQDITGLGSLAEFYAFNFGFIQTEVDLGHGRVRKLSKAGIPALVVQNGGRAPSILARRIGGAA